MSDTIGPAFGSPAYAGGPIGPATLNLSPQATFINPAPIEQAPVSSPATPSEAAPITGASGVTPSDYTMSPIDFAYGAAANLAAAAVGSVSGNPYLGVAAGALVGGYSYMEQNGSTVPSVIPQGLPGAGQGVYSGYLDQGGGN